jgi:DNA-binding transcriptional regulator/RsmH inhibitor MraZ
MAWQIPGFEYSFVGIGKRMEVWNQQHFGKSGTQTRTMKKTQKYKFKFFK